MLPSRVNERHHGRLVEARREKEDRQSPVVRLRLDRVQVKSEPWDCDPMARVGYRFREDQVESVPSIVDRTAWNNPYPFDQYYLHRSPWNFKELTCHPPL
jgi:hypothetical protein